MPTGSRSDDLTVQDRNLLPGSAPLPIFAPDELFFEAIFEAATDPTQTAHVL